MKSLKIMALLLSMLLCFTACAADPAQGKNTLTSSPDSQNSLTGGSTSDASQFISSQTDSPDASSYPLSLQNYGREVTINKRPEKVLALGPNCAELLVALGLEDVIIGTSLRNHSRGPLPEYEAVFENLPEINHSSATREAVISSGADFVYGLDWEFGGSGLDISELESYGMTVYVNAATSLEEQYQEIMDLGRIFAIEETAADFVEDQKIRISEIQTGIDADNMPTVLVYDSGNDGVFTCSGINFESLLIKEAGAVNLFDDLSDKAWVTVSYEEVLARNPDIILIHDYDSPSVEEKIADIEANDVLAQLDCVKNKRYALIELESVLPGNRMAHSIERLHEAFYSN